MLAMDNAKLMGQQTFILFVEVERIIQPITISLLEDLNCRVYLACNGIELSQRIQNQKKLVIKPISIVILTANLKEEFQQACKFIGN